MLGPRGSGAVAGWRQWTVAAGAPAGGDRPPGGDQWAWHQSAIMRVLLVALLTYFGG